VRCRREERPVAEVFIRGPFSDAEVFIRGLLSDAEFYFRGPLSELRAVKNQALAEASHAKSDLRQGL
jgi:hypothetical protein